MKEIKVSVIVPIYNAEKYLEECIDSICNQTLKEIEILLVNDESTDGSLVILERYAKEDSRVRIIQNVHEGEGAASARNAGLKEAKGKYLSFLDSDDFFVQEMLEKAYNKAEKCNADIVMYDYCFFDETTHIVTDINDTLRYPTVAKKEIFNCMDCPDEIFDANNLMTWPKLYRSTFIFDENLWYVSGYRGDDACFVINALSLAKSICVLPETMIYYRRHTGSRSINREKNPLALIESLLYSGKTIIEKGVPTSVVNGLMNYIINLCYGYPLNFYDVQTFHAFFDGLQQKHFSFMESNITDSVLTVDVYTFLHRLKNNHKSEWLFELLQQQKRPAFCFETEVVFPYALVEKTDKVILYGAGHIGTGFYLQNLQGNHCQIIAWVDQNAKDKQYPIEGLEALKTKQCDKIIVAIDNEAVFQKVRAYLMELGFQSVQIINGVVRKK